MRRPLLLALLLLLPGPVRAELPLPLYPSCGAGGACPSDFDPSGEWHLSSQFPPGMTGVIPPGEEPLGPGMWVDRAWSVTTGRTDVLIAGFDSGVDWDAGDLLNKWAINTGELPAPAGYPQDAAGQHRGTWDFDGNGVVTMADWAEDPRILPDLAVSANGRNGSVKDPSDLIAYFSDGVDDDANGYVDDVCGWDFFWNDNDAEDEVRHDGYSHGTKEGRWSAAEGNGAGGDIGTCPNCMFLPIRVGDGFVGDVNNFALAAIYAVDRGAQVLQVALGTLNNTELTKQAIEYAWDRGVLFVGSAADETAWHANAPALNHHGLYTSAIRHDRQNPEGSSTFLANSNCTNHGARLDLSVSGLACASAATGLSAGIAGLVYSAMKDRIDAGTLDGPLSAAEIRQLLLNAVDDIAVNPLDDQPTLYPSRPGWDAYFGYGRLNAWKAVTAVRDGVIPPVADLTEPGWFDFVDPSPTATVRFVGRASARFAPSYAWTLEVGGGVDPTDWTQVAAGSGAAEQELDVAVAVADLPGDPEATIRAWTQADRNVAKLHEVHKHMVTARLRVTDAAGLVGEQRKAFWVVRDPDLLPGFPLRAGTSLEVSPKLADVDGDGVDDVITISSDGVIAVRRGDGTMLPGWPVRFPLLRELDPANDDAHTEAPAFASGAVPASQPHAALSAPGVADLDGDGSVEIVAASLKGALYVLHADGTMAQGFPFWLDPSLVRGRANSENVYDYGFFGAPALADLDGDEDLEIVIGAMDAFVYVLQHDGTPLPGWPLELRHSYDFFGETVSNGARIISSPAVGDVDGDGFPEIAIGTNQKQGGTYGLGYLLSHDGQVEPGWPISAFGAYTNALPYVGEGIPGSPALCDLDGDGRMEVAMHTIADPGRIYAWDGTDYARLDSIAGRFGAGTNSREQAASIIMIASGAFGDVDGDGGPDYAIGSSAFEYAAGLLDDGRRHDHEHLMGAWSGTRYLDGDRQRMPFVPAFPRVMEDLQFFLSPSIADLDGDGAMEVIQGSAGGVIHAFDRDGEEPAGWPKQAGGWVLGSVAVGDADGDGYLDVWTGTREGWLLAWRTTARADTSPRAWASFRHDPANTGNCATPLRAYPGPPDPPPPPDPEPGCPGCPADDPGPAAVGLLALAALGPRRRAR